MWQLRAVVPRADQQAEEQHHQPRTGFGLGHAAQQQEGTAPPEQPVQPVRAADHQQQRHGYGEGDHQGKVVRVIEHPGCTAIVLVFGREHRHGAGRRDTDGNQFGEHVEVQLTPDQQGDDKQNQADAQFAQVAQGEAHVVGVQQAQQVQHHEPDQETPDIAAQALARQLVSRQLQHQDQRQRSPEEFGARQ
ncbi:hypothetical protein D9M71_287730 [compost metagenome]